jgi:hypothetical protein
MRQFGRFVLRHRSSERGFYTEAQILKFTLPRGQDSLTKLVLADPNSSINTGLIEVATTAELTRLLGLAKGASQ